MPIELKQRYFFITRTFELTGNSLKVKIRKPGVKIDDEFKFEDIARKTTRVQSFPVFYFLFFLFGLIAFTVALLGKLSGDDGFETEAIIGLGLFTCVSGYACAARHQNNLNLFLIDGRCVLFFAASPSRYEVDQFIDTLASTQKKYLLNKYARPDDLTSPERLATQLKWLHDHGFIDDAELRTLKNKLLLNSNAPAGFTFNLNLN